MNPDNAPDPAAGGPAVPTPAGEPSQRPAGKGPSFWKWPQKERLEILAYVAAIAFFLVKLDSGGFSTAISVIPACRAVGTPERPQVAATVELKADESLKTRLIALEAPILAVPSESRVGMCRFYGLGREIEFKNGRFREKKGEVASLTPGETATFECVSGPLPASRDTPLVYTVDVRAAVERAGYLNALRDYKERRATCVVAVNRPAPGAQPQE